MQVAIFIGSPRKNGNTFAMANLLAEQLKDEEIDVDVFDLYDHDIEPCIDCRECNKEQLICMQSDGMKKLYAKMEESDVLVFGTPVYWFGASGRTKLMIDRFKPYFVNKKLYGKKAALLLPSAVQIDERDLTIEQFRRLFKALGIEYLDAISMEAYEKGDVLKNENFHNLIIDLKDRILQSQHNVLEK
ncbi:flavodoxin family protein [Carboxylicivirga linearis]|nr:flavodoxin family protein [Carboxylicivirga linearis]